MHRMSDGEPVLYKLGHVKCFFFFYLFTYIFKKLKKNLNKVALSLNLIPAFVKSFLVCLPLSV